MACKGCRKKINAAPGSVKRSVGSNFGRCPKCFLLTIIGLVVSMLLVPLSLFIQLPDGFGWIRIVPLCFFAIWLTLHLVGYFRSSVRY